MIPFNFIIHINLRFVIFSTDQKKLKRRSLVSRVAMQKRPVTSAIYQSSPNFGFEGFIMGLVYL